MKPIPTSPKVIDRLASNSDSVTWMVYTSNSLNTMQTDGDHKEMAINSGFVNERDTAGDYQLHSVVD